MSKMIVTFAADDYPYSTDFFVFCGSTNASLARFRVGSIVAYSPSHGKCTLRMTLTSGSHEDIRFRTTAERDQALKELDALLFELSRQSTASVAISRAWLDEIEKPEEESGELE